MPLQLERKRRSPETTKRLVSLLETLDHLTLAVTAAPAAESPPSRTVCADCPHALRSSDDDFANATWEDAEWQ